MGGGKEPLFFIVIFLVKLFDIEMLTLSWNEFVFCCEDQSGTVLSRGLGFVLFDSFSFLFFSFLLHRQVEYVAPRSPDLPSPIPLSRSHM